MNIQVLRNKLVFPYTTTLHAVILQRVYIKLKELATLQYPGMSVRKKPLNPDQALQKLRHYCGYQERCHSEISLKLYKLKIAGKHHDAIIASLIEEEYLDEERFAIAFAGGKFRINQ